MAAGISLSPNKSPTAGTTTVPPPDAVLGIAPRAGRDPRRTELPVVLGTTPSGLVVVGSNMVVYVLTLHLNAVDISRTVVRSVPSAMTELAAAGERMMQPSSMPPHLTTWAARTRASLRPIMRPYLDLCTVPRWVPDFIDPPSSDDDFAVALDKVMATPPSAIRAELQSRVVSGQLSPRAAALASGDPAAIRRLRTAMEAFHEVAVAPYWPQIVAAVHADRAARGSTLLDEGIERVLHTLSPYLRWNSSSLSYECPGGTDLEISASGRGVILVPTYLDPSPSFLDVDGAPVVLHYPIEKLPPQLTPRKPLTDLLGRTRASVLAAVAGGRSTTQVARNVGISAGSVSQHAAVLRSAGLITTHRTGPSVRHQLTPLGELLLVSSSQALHSNSRSVAQ